MKKKSIKKNYIYNLSYQILLLLMPLITTPYISRVLGAEVIGTVSYVASIVSYFVLFATMGITTYGQREISYVQDSVYQRSLIFWNTKVLSFCITAVVLVAFVVFSLYQNDHVLYLIYSISILSVTLDITWFFQGLEEFEKIVLRNVAFKIINIAYIFLFVKSKDDIYLYVLGNVAFQAVSNAVLWRFIPSHTQKVSLRELHPFKDIKVVLSLFIPTIAIQIYTVLDKTMIGIITQSAAENGFYELAIRLSKMPLTVVTALGTVVIPRLGYYFNNGEFGEVRRLMYRSYRFVWFLGIPLCFGLVMVAGNFVPWFFGPGNERIIPLIRILALLILAIGINNVTGVQYFIPTKRQGLFTFTVAVGAVINFALNLVLIKKYQSVGAAIASVVAEASIAIIQLLIVKNELSSVKVLREGTSYYFAGGIMAFGLYFIGQSMQPSIVNTMLLVVSGACIYFVSLLMLKDSFFISYLEMVLRRIGIKNNKLMGEK